MGAHVRVDFSRMQFPCRVQVIGAHTTLHHATPCWAASAARTFVTIARRWRALARCCAFGDGRQQAGTCQEAARHLVRSLSGVPSRRSRPPVLSSSTNQRGIATRTPQQWGGYLNRRPASTLTHTIASMWARWRAAQVRTSPAQLVAFVLDREEGSEGGRGEERRTRSYPTRKS